MCSNSSGSISLGNDITSKTNVNIAIINADIIYICEIFEAYTVDKMEIISELFASFEVKNITARNTKRGLKRLV